VKVGKSASETCSSVPRIDDPDSSGLEGLDVKRPQAENAGGDGRGFALIKERTLRERPA
jgi:hypothetical protein